MTEIQCKKPHHHGDLRAALVRAGLEILDESGREALTLRACAARVGVSHAAPAHHFEGLPGLLSAIIAEGYAIFTATMLAHRDRAEDAPRARLLAICDGYMQFSADHPGLFTLMFNAGHAIPPSAEMSQNAEAAYGVLRDACAPFELVSDHPQSTEMLVWSAVHGLASLRQGRRLYPGYDDQGMPTIRDIFPPLRLRE